MSQGAAPARQNGMTTCLETFEKEKFCIFPHRRGEATGKSETRDETRGNTITNISSGASPTFLSHLETTHMDKFYSFAHRHSEVTRKPETREKTGGITKTHFVRDFRQFPQMEI
jgi:hypothetical protein